jgi:hypothetical protein
MPDMIQNRLAANAFRLSITAVFALLVFASGAPAQAVEPAKTNSIDGVYNGSYAGDHGPVKFKLTLTQAENGTLGGGFTLYLPDGADTKAYTCDVKGRYIAANRMVVVLRGKWETLPPGGIDMLGMNGVFDPDGGKGAGQISGKMRARPAPSFEAIRDMDESAKLATANAAKKAAEPPPAVAAATKGGRPAAAAAAPTSRPRGAYIPRTEIDGVYTGTFGSNPDDKVPAKLYVKFINNGSVNGILDGLFTFEVPPAPEAKPVTYTYKLAGTYAVGAIQFYSAKPLGNPAPDAYAVKEINAEFDKTPLVKGGNGQLTFDFIPDQISGKVIGSNALRSFNKIEAKRDKEESAKLDKLMAAQASAASVAVSTTAPAAAAAVVPGATVVRPSILGVFNGTYTRANEPPTKFKLTITRAPYTGGATGIVALGGLATIYLPADSGTKAYTYSLKGVLDGNGAFHLSVNDWETIPPKDFKDFKSMGFSGTFLSNVNQNTARIISAAESGPNASFFVPKFEAKWDATESADIKATIAAQKGVGDADQVAALKAHAEAVKNAKPKQLASKDLVRKSQAYWDNYGSDIIREVFDGGFASDVDEEPAFQLLFTTYVELFSKNCSAYLPADHKTVTITTVTTRRGVVVDTKTTTLEMDPRFIEKYGEFIGVAPAPGSDKEKEQTAKTLAIAGRLFNRGGPSHGTSPADAVVLLRRIAARGISSGLDMDKFFAAEVKANGPSAALRQMGENLLRGATGEPSLQEAGGKIDGTEAETDKDLPPGRFARFIDGANAFYRERAKADPIRFGHRESHDAAFCEILAAKYQNVMTREEEYYYANDFEGRFFGQIMQPRQSSTDPAWPRLHPAVEKSVAEIQ